MHLKTCLAIGFLILSTVGCGGTLSSEDGEGRIVEEELVLRVATFNIEDLRTAELLDRESPRPASAAAILQQIRPDIVLINEIAYDQPGHRIGSRGRSPVRMASDSRTCSWPNRRAMDSSRSNTEPS